MILLALLMTIAAGPAPVRVGFVGDLSFAGRVDEPAEVFGAVLPILGAPDIMVANVEGLLLEQGAPRYREARLDISANPRYAEALRRSGIDLFGAANNHAWDAGVRGVHEQLASLRGLPLFGIGPSAALAFAPVRKATAVGCLSFIPATLKSNRPRADGASVAWYGPRGERPVAALEALVLAERAAGCAPIVSIHWGREARVAPDERVVALGRALVAAGATLVVGHHPHVLQGVEWLHAAHGQAAIAWSLGNFVFKNRDPEKRRTGLLEASFARTAPSEAPALEALAFTPMTIDATTLRPRPATTIEARATARALSERSMRFATAAVADGDRLVFEPGRGEAR